MAGDWIKWEKGLPQKPKVVAMAAELGLDRRIVAALCMRFWEWADDVTTTGRVPNITIEFIDDLVRTPGFTKVFSKVGWIRLQTDGISIPNFKRHNGKSAKRRALQALRVAQKRAHRERTKSAPEQSRAEQSRARAEIASAAASKKDDLALVAQDENTPIGMLTKVGFTPEQADTVAALVGYDTKHVAYAVKRCARMKRTGKLRGEPEAWITACLKGRYWEKDGAA